MVRLACCRLMLLVCGGVVGMFRLMQLVSGGTSVWGRQLAGGVGLLEHSGHASNVKQVTLAVFSGPERHISAPLSDMSSLSGVDEVVEQACGGHDRCDRMGHSGEVVVKSKLSGRERGW